MISIREHKQHIVYTKGKSFDEVFDKYLLYNNIWYKRNFDKIYHNITSETVNGYLRMVIEIPKLLSQYQGWRFESIERSSYYIKHHSDIIDKEVKEIIEQYFDWLKEREDYVESPEDTILRIERQRISSRAKKIEVELIEKLYHPDRYERFVANYGEIWADTHLPY